ncbi:MAG: glycosyl transferase family 28 [Rhodospirillaceae bacterium]|nr:glycosyl transferase family 28 [Rhodospirillaceae bacterium]
MARRRRILIHVQHLLGSGHLRRAAKIARTLAAAGHETLLVSGGMPVPDLDTGGADLLQLPPLRAADESFSTLVDDAGRAADNTIRNARRALLLRRFAAFGPHALIVEMYPFGRRSLAFEIEPLLDAAWAARPRPLILSSVRDVVPRKSAKREAGILAAARDRFDRILVHGDPALLPFEASFPPAAALGDRLTYTGYVTPEPEAPGGPDAPGHDEVLVSAGGGAVGARLLRAARDARPLSARASDRRWRLIAGGALAEGAYRNLAAGGDDGLVVERHRPDFRALLANCHVSVSQAGYNTASELLAAGKRAVVVPYVGRGETEQSLRAERLALHGFVVSLAEADLTPTTLAAAVDSALAAPAAKGPRPRMDGAGASLRLIEGWLGNRAG